MYEQVDFQALPDRPFFYTNFVSTPDGKVDVPAHHADYWPIGSPLDYTELINLRVPADALIHGSHMAIDHRVVDRLAKPEFKAARQARGKTKDIVYVVLSGNPNQALKDHLKDDAGIETLLVDGKDLVGLAKDLKARGVDVALVEGGPHILASFFAADLIDEIFLTLAPKVFGGGGLETLTMAEGTLLPPEKVKTWKLVSATPAGDEVFLRYRR